MNIEIEIPVAALKSALPGFSKIISKKTTLPVLGCVKVSRVGDEFVTIEATNLDETVQFRLRQAANNTGPGEMIVPWENLAKIVKGCSAKESIWLVAEGKRTIIRYPLGGGLVEQPIDAIDLKEWPLLPVIDSAEIIFGDEFKETLKQALDCGSTDSSRYILNGACLDVSSGKGHYIVGTDGRHLYAANTFQFNLATSVVVANKRFLFWDIFVADGPWHLRVKTFGEKEPQSWLRLDSDHWTYIARQIDGNYPNWKQVVPTPNSRWTKLILDASAVQTMLDAIPLLPGGDLLNQPVELKIQTHGLVLTGRDKEGRASDVSIPGVRIIGLPVETSLNREYLLKPLRFGFREIAIDNPVEPIVFTKDGKTMVVMPVRGAAAEKWYADHPPQDSPPAGATAENSKTEGSAPPEGEERKNMEPTMQPPSRGNLKSHDTPADSTAIDEVLEQVEKVKAELREVFNGLTETERLLKKAAKEKKATEKEVEKVRTSLRSLQGVAI